MTEIYLHTICGGGFFTKCKLELNLKSKIFTVNFESHSLSNQNIVQIHGIVNVIGNNYYVLKSSLVLFDEIEYTSVENKSGITFEFIKLYSDYDICEHNNEWKDITHGNMVKFNKNYNFDSMLIIQHDIFDMNIVDFHNEKMKNLLKFFHNMKFLQVS